VTKEKDRRESKSSGGEVWVVNSAFVEAPNLAMKSTH